MDSEEEVWFAHWLKEAKKHRYVYEDEYHPFIFMLSEKAIYTQEIQLKTKIKHQNKTLLNAHVYTPDWKLRFTEKFFDKFGDILINSKANECVVIDIKGTFGKFNDDTVFSINRKWVYKEYGVYVHKIIPKKWFRKTWVPKAIAFKKNMEIRKPFLACKFVEEI